MLRRIIATAALLVCGRLCATDDAPKAGEVRLYTQDKVRIGVQGEPDVSVERQIGTNGDVNVPLIGSVKIGGLTLAEAQQTIADRYVSEEIFIHPEVVVMVVSYAPKEVTVLGQVGKQGKIAFPAEVSTLGIVEAIASAGGMTRIASGSSVRVTRHDPEGKEQIFTVNVDKMVQGSGGGEKFALQPGDVVFVPERVF